MQWSNLKVLIEYKTVEAVHVQQYSPAERVDLIESNFSSSNSAKEMAVKFS